MGVAMSVMAYPNWDGLAFVSASGIDGPASDSVGSASGFEGAALWLG